MATASQRRSGRLAPTRPRIHPHPCKHCGRDVFWAETRDGHRDILLDFEVAADGRYVVTGGWRVHLTWVAAEGEPGARYHQHNVKCSAGRYRKDEHGGEA